MEYSFYVNVYDKKFYRRFVSEIDSEYDLSEAELRSFVSKYDPADYVIDVSVIGHDYNVTTDKHADSLDKAFESLYRQLRGTPTREKWLAAINNMSNDELAELYVSGDMKEMFEKLH